ncbi:MAG: archaeal proteasome endopeptidase complex subunit alpha [Candidatus Diapherotrites archaeon]|nr:archaeal proteasome endopeptidase complex subunit alpha [Candidatus Diapherotrites archaeon]
MYGAPNVGGYDRALTIFSPQGDLFQVMYAKEAVKRGGLAVAIRYKDGIVFGTKHQFVSKLLTPESFRKIFQIEDNIVISYSGMVGDARHLLTFAREKAEEYRLVYGTEIPLNELIKEVSAVVQLYTQYGGVRPYGVSLMIGGVTDHTTKLAEISPDGGATVGAKAWAIGEKAEAVKSHLEKNYKENMSFEDAVKLLFDAMTASEEKKKGLDLGLLEIAVLDRKKGGYKEFKPEEVSKLMGKK